MKPFVRPPKRSPEDVNGITGFRLNIDLLLDKTAQRLDLSPQSIHLAEQCHIGNPLKSLKGPVIGSRLADYSWLDLDRGTVFLLSPLTTLLDRSVLQKDFWGLKHISSTGMRNTSMRHQAAPQLLQLHRRARSYTIWLWVKTGGPWLTHRMHRTDYQGHGFGAQALTIFDPHPFEHQFTEACGGKQSLHDPYMKYFRKTKKL